MSASIILENISEILDANSQRHFDVEIKIRRVEDSYENLITDLQQKVNAGIISEQGSIEVEYVADMWLNLYKLFICRSAGATLADRDVINYLIELNEVKQISNDFFIEITLILCRSASFERVTEQCIGEKEQNYEHNI